MRPPPQIATTAPAAPSDPAQRGAGCLTVDRLGPGTFRIENSGCANSVVLAAIEVYDTSHSITCYIARIRDTLALTSRSGAPPRINHHCSAGKPGCAEAALRTMFPECRSPE